MSREKLGKLLIAGLVLVGIGAFVVAGLVADTDGPELGASSDIIEAVAPRDGDEVLRQAKIGIDLAPGWGLASLSLNGVAIPENEWVVTSGLSLYEFIPADDKVITTLSGDRNCATATVFQLDDPANTRPHTWCFTAA